MSLLSEAFSREELEGMLSKWKECYEAAAAGQVAYYRIGTREAQIVDPEVALKNIREIQDALDEKAGNKKARVRRVVYRDL